MKNTANTMKKKDFVQYTYEVWLGLRHAQRGWLSARIPYWLLPKKDVVFFLKICFCQISVTRFKAA